MAGTATGVVATAVSLACRKSATWGEQQSSNGNPKNQGREEEEEGDGQDVLRVAGSPGEGGRRTECREVSGEAAGGGENDPAALCRAVLSLEKLSSCCHQTRAFFS